MDRERRERRERREAYNSFVIGYLSSRLDGVDGLTTDEWIQKAEKKAANTVKGGSLPNPGVPDGYLTGNRRGSRS